MISTLTRNAAPDEDIDDALRAAFAVHEGPPATLQSRLDSTLADTQQAQARRRARGRTVRRGLALSGALGVVALAVVALPKILVRRALAQMAVAAENVRSMHRVSWATDPDGRRRKVDEAWFQDGRWRIESPRSVQIFSGGKSYLYEPRARLATWRKADGPFAHNSSGFSIGAMMADITRWGWGDKITLAPEAQVLEGRRVRVATIEPARENIRIVIYAEPETLLPLRMDLLRPTSTPGGKLGWKIARTSTMEYNIALPAEKFEARFPPGTRVVEPEAERDRWARSLHKTLAVLQHEKQRIVVRDVSMNERGDVFVLFTTGREHDVSPGPFVTIDVEKPPLKLRGESSEFLPAEISVSRPSVGWAYDADGPQVKRRMEGARVDDEPLQWQVWTRLEPLAPAQAERPQRVWLSVQPEAFVPRGGSWVRADLPESERVAFDIPRATFALAPGYASSFPVPLSEADLLNACDEVRAHALRYGPRRGEGPNPEELRRSLELYRAVIVRTEEQWRATGNSGVQPDKWLAVAELSLKLGRTEESREALSRAEQDNRIYGNPTDGTTRSIEELKQQVAHG